MGPSKHLPTICYHSDSSFFFSFFFSFFDTHRIPRCLCVCLKMLAGVLREIYIATSAKTELNSNDSDNNVSI